MRIIIKVTAFILFCTVLAINNCGAQTVKAPKQVIVKTNVANLLLLFPSVHLEHSLGKKTSLQFNAHYTRFRFMRDDYNNLLNLSTDFRYYLGSKSKDILHGFYPSIGFGSYSELNRYYYSNSIYKKGNITAVGPQIKFGFQFQVPKRRFVIDANIGAHALLIDMSKNDYFRPRLIPRWTCAYCYRISKN